jgi:hypothetical protein
MATEITAIISWAREISDIIRWTPAFFFHHELFFILNINQNKLYYYNLSIVLMDPNKDMTCDWTKHLIIQFTCSRWSSHFLRLKIPTLLTNSFLLLSKVSQDFISSSLGSVSYISDFVVSNNMTPFCWWFKEIAIL